MRSEGSTREALVSYERARYSSQLSFVEGWLGPLREARVQPDALAFRKAWDARSCDPEALRAQLRADLERDAVRLATAAAGAGRSAVPSGDEVALPTRCVFADEQAHHIASAVHRFAQQAAKATGDASLRDAIEREQRWAQRLRWELLDTRCRDTPWTVGLSLDALRSLAQRRPLAEINASALAYADAVQRLMQRLRGAPVNPGTDETTAQ